MTHGQVLSTVKGMSEAKIEKMIEAAKKLKVSLVQVVDSTVMDIGYRFHDWIRIFGEAPRCHSHIHRKQRIG